MEKSDIAGSIDIAKLMIKIYEERGGDTHKKEALKTLIELAENYLKINGIMPEKIKDEIIDGESMLTLSDKHRNELIDLCTLALSQKLEGLTEVIENVKYIGQVKHYTLDREWANSIANAVYKHITRSSTKI